MLELAGAAAAVQISAAASPAFIRWSLDRVRRGEAASGRNVRKIALVYAAMAEDEKTAHDRLRRTLGFVLRGPHHRRNLALGGAALDQPALASAYAREEWAAVDRLVGDDVIRSPAASGTPAQFRAALARYQSAGLDEIALAGIGGTDDLRRVLDAASAAG